MLDTKIPEKKDEDIALELKQYILKSNLRVNGLWDMRQLADFLNLPVQSLYDYRYREKINDSIFIHVGRKLRINPWKAIELALKGKLIKHKDKPN